MGIEMTMEGVEELKSSMQLALDKCPDEMNRAIRSQSRSWVKDCNAKMPGHYYNVPKDRHTPIPKNWSRKESVNNLGNVEEIEIRNKSPHFHLVENGHREYDFHGKPTGGFVPGKHFAEETRNEYESKYPESMEKAADRALKKAGLL